MKQFILITIFIFIGIISFSQEPAQSYPKVVGYASFIHPIVTIDKNTTTYNFKDSYTVIFPFGINLLKSDKIGFSFEIAPVIKAENGSSRVNNFLFHPGVMFRFKKGMTFITRMAFETSGRYGITPVFSKIFYKMEKSSLYIAGSVPMRFGNDKPTSFGLGVQLGVVF